MKRFEARVLRPIHLTHPAGAEDANHFVRTNSRARRDSHNG